MDATAALRPLLLEYEQVTIVLGGMMLVVPLTMRTARVAPAIGELGISVHSADEVKAPDLPARLELTWLGTCTRPPPGPCGGLMSLKLGSSSG